MKSLVLAALFGFALTATAANAGLQENLVKYGHQIGTHGILGK